MNNYLILALVLFFLCAPAWVIAFLLFRFTRNFEVVFKVKEKVVAQEKSAVVPDVVPEVDMTKINERLDTALAARRIEDNVESHVSGLGREVSLDSEDHSLAISKLRNIGK